MPYEACPPTQSSASESTPKLPLTVQAAIEWVATWTDQSPSQRKQIQSSLSSLAKKVGLPRNAVELTPEALRTTFLAQSAVGHGVSLSRMRSILSHVRKVLRRADVIDAADASIMASWNSLLTRLDYRQRAGVIGFARFCSSLQIKPGDVTTETLQAFEARIGERSLVPRCRKRIGSLRSFWNKAAQTVPGWPPVQLGGARPHDYILKPDAFSDAFRLDLSRFGDRLIAAPFDGLAAFNSSDRLSRTDPGGDVDPMRKAISRMKPVRTITRDSRVDHARWAASAAAASGALPLVAISGVRELVTPLHHPRAIFQFLHERAGKKPSSAGTHVADVLRIIARHDVGLPEEEVERIIRWGNVVRLRYDSMTEKNEKTVREASSPRADAILLTLPDRLMSAASKVFDQDPKSAVSSAWRGMAIELLLKTPLRSKELLGLRLDQHLQRSDPKRSRITHISIPPWERKASVPYSVRVSDETGEILETWIKKFRPIIAAPNCLYLFPSFTGGDGPITRQALREAIVTLTKRHVGVALTPHAFRHLAGHHYLEAHPGNYGAVSRLLGHKDMATAQRFYLRRENERAHREYDEVVLRRKDSMGLKLQPGKRR